MTYILKLAVIGTVTVPAALVTLFLGLLDRHGKRVYPITRFWSAVILATSRIRLRVQGLGRLDRSQAYLFVVNHQSNIDIPVLIHSLSAFQLRWIAKKELLRVPFFGWAMWAAKHIAVDRGDVSGAGAVLKQAKAHIANGISVVVFPEGTRSQDGRLLPFKRGAFILAAKMRVPIVPVTINGSANILPKGEWRLRSGTVDVYCSDPIPMAHRGPGSIRDLAAAVKRTMEENLETVSSSSGTLKASAGVG